MRIKRLEVQGFKSFKDKTVIHFDHTITGIVGPNGCGKSNIVDAFFWVMGEQSYKHMRGSGAEDLIFNGSSKYAPTAFAEATLVMETEAIDPSLMPAGASAADIPVHLRAKEVSVTRRVYREGGGEYLINGVQARLKDIHELFMDTGVGAKGYSIIEQGQIGKIVNAKPEDRRVLIEEAAGIAKYKARKKESMRKMETAQLNLSRLNDVIQEIERSLNSLERQAQKAGQYKKLKEELLSKEMTWGRRRNLVLRTRLDDLREKRDTLEQDLVGLRAELSTSETTIETDRVDQLTLTKQAEELQASINEMSSDLTRAQSALDLSRRRQSDLTSQLDMLESEKLDLETAIITERENIDSLEGENASAAEAFTAHAGGVAEKEARVREVRGEADSARRTLENLNRELMRGIGEASNLTSRAAALDSRAESIKLQIERLETQASELGERVETARSEVAEARSQLTEAQDLRAKLHAETQSTSDTVRQKDAELREARRALETQNRDLTKLRSRLQSLEELAAAHEGFGDGPKAILDWAREQGNESALKALADGLEVQSGYEAALEGWLEGRLENFTSDDASFAIQALRDLSQGQTGRAAIYIAAEKPRDLGSLDTVTQSLASLGFTVEGPLSNFVTLNDRLGEAGQAAAQSLLAGVITIQDFSPLTDGTSITPAALVTALEGYALVGRDGMALDHDGALRGGSIQSDNSASLLGRKRAITELETQVAEIESVFTAEEARVAGLSESLDLAQAKLASLKAEFQSAEIESAKLDRDVQQLSRTLKDIESSAARSSDELNELREDREAALSERAELDDSLKAVLETRTDLEERLGAQNGIAEEKDAALREEDSALNALKVLEAQLKERANSVKRELEAGLNLIRDRERRLADVTRTLDRARNENEEHSGGDADSIGRIEELTRALGERRETLSLVKDQLSIISAKVNGALSRMKELHSDGDRKTAEVNQHSLDIERLNADLSHLTQNLEEKYGPGCLDLASVSPIQDEMGDPIVTQEMSAEEEAILSQDVERIREKIRRLGDVNPTAVEEYEEKKGRFDYLMTEKQDLEKSIEDLMQAIEHINITSEERFRKAFEAIADRFERLFPIIFGGGQAKLSLVYPEGSSEILDAGVEILAQPPGKKVVNIGLLSGGEKALTAVSLIFAIFMVKPSPFCILDEVDAPLDDTNVGKFNALLREMSAKSQFIIITHNKKTMELNDTLYGVTMEEPGVSKMVSIEMH